MLHNELRWVKMIMGDNSIYKNWSGSGNKWIYQIDT